MSNFKKRFRNALGSIADGSSAEATRNPSGKSRADSINGGLAQLKNKLGETAAALDAAWSPAPFDGTALAPLIRQQNQQARLLNENYGRFRACKRILIADESRSKLDSAVHQAYFGHGGIRFYIRILRENAADLDPQQNVNRMLVSCYNSAICPMVDLQQKMERKCAALEEAIRQAEAALSDPEALYRALRYTPCGDTLKALKEQLQQGTCADPEGEIQALQKVLDSNAAALETMVRLCDPMPEPAPLKNAVLRADLAELLDQRKLESLRTPENRTPEDYAAGIRDYLAELETRLLTRYLLPGEAAADKDIRN